MPRTQRVDRLKDVYGIGVDKMGDAADAACDSTILRLENLDTDIPPPAGAIEATRNAIDMDRNNSYLPFIGQSELRQAATEHVARTSGIDYDWRSQSVICAGGTSGILICLLALINPGDEVIITDPVYAGLLNRIRLAGGVIKSVPLIPSEQGWRLNIEALKQAASPRTRVVLIVSPSMPTGHVLNTAEWSAVNEVCQQTDAWLLYDAAMERILYDDRKVIHPASLPNMEDRTITVGTASKELRMIGWRVGWIIGPQAIMNDIGLVSMANVVCQVGIAMPGVAAALNAPGEDIKNAVKVWQGRRDLLLRELQGLPVIPPHGGWSLLIDTESLGMTPVRAAELLFKHAKVAATPMIGWGQQAARYLRLVFSNEPEERLLGVGEKIKRALNEN